MTYDEAIAHLRSLQLHGFQPGLETTRRLAALSGDPQESLRFIHVAGTNGKGSTCALLESVYRKAGLKIGDNVRIAAHVVIIPENHIYERSDLPIRYQGVSSLGVTIGSDVWIGSGAKVLDGVSIGDGCVIGANAVVVKDIPPFSVAVGAPARPIRSRLK